MISNNLFCDGYCEEKKPKQAIAANRKKKYMKSITTGLASAVYVGQTL